MDLVVTRSYRRCSLTDLFLVLNASVTVSLFLFSVHILGGLTTIQGDTVVSTRSESVTITRRSGVVSLGLCLG